VHEENTGCAGRIQGARGESRVRGENPGMRWENPGMRWENPGCMGRIQGARGALTKKFHHGKLLFTMVKLPSYHGEMVILAFTMVN
jgi:hypothetical protein